MKIAKLLSTNYYTQSTSVWIYLKEEGLQDYIKLITALKGTKLELEGAEKIEKDPLDPKKDAQAYLIIIRLYTLEAFRYIQLIKVVVDQQERLKRVFQLLRRAQISAKAKAFLYYTPKSRLKVDNIVAQLDDLQLELEAINLKERPIDNIKLLILTRVVEELDQRLRLYIINVDTNLNSSSYSVVVTKLTKVERRLNIRKDAKKDLLEATIKVDGDLKKKGKKRGGNKGAISRDYYYYSKLGHQKADYFQLKKEGGRSDASTSPLATPKGSQGLSLPRDYTNLVQEEVQTTIVDQGVEGLYTSIKTNSAKSPLKEVYPQDLVTS